MCNKNDSYLMQFFSVIPLTKNEIKHFQKYSRLSTEFVEAKYDERYVSCVVIIITQNLAGKGSRF